MGLVWYIKSLNKTKDLPLQISTHDGAATMKHLLQMSLSTNQTKQNLLGIKVLVWSFSLFQFLVVWHFHFNISQQLHQEEFFKLYLLLQWFYWVAIISGILLKEGLSAFELVSCQRSHVTFLNPRFDDGVEGIFRAGLHFMLMYWNRRACMISLSM